MNNWVITQNQYVWNNENAFLNYLRRKLPVTVGGGFITSITTTGSSGAATVVGGVLNIPVYTGASQSWDQTLAVSNITTRSFEQDQTTIGTEQNYQVFKPANYNGTTIGLYNSWVNDTFVNVDGRRDVVMSWHSYNYASGGSRISTGDAAFAFKSEQYYLQDGTNLMEFHLPEMITTTGTPHRAWSFYIHRPTGFCYMQAQTDHISFNRYFNNATYFDVSSGTSEAGGGTAGPADMLLSSIGAASGAFVRYTMFDSDGGFLEFTSIANAQKIRAGLDFTIQPGRYMNMPLNLNFNQADYFGNGTVTLVAPDNTAVHGFLFTGLDGTPITQFYKGAIQSWVPHIMQGYVYLNGINATQGQLFWALKSTPATPADGAMWLESNTNTGLKIRINGVIKTVSLV